MNVRSAVGGTSIRIIHPNAWDDNPTDPNGQSHAEQILVSPFLTQPPQAEACGY
jgi:hypothetical protein